MPPEVISGILRSFSQFSISSSSCSSPLRQNRTTQALLRQNKQPSPVSYNRLRQHNHTLGISNSTISHTFTIKLSHSLVSFLISLLLFLSERKERKRIIISSPLIVFILVSKNRYTVLFWVFCPILKAFQEQRLNNLNG